LRLIKENRSLGGPGRVGSHATARSTIGGVFCGIDFFNSGPEHRAKMKLGYELGRGRSHRPAPRPHRNRRRVVAGGVASPSIALALTSPLASFNRGKTVTPGQTPRAQAAAPILPHPRAASDPAASSSGLQCRRCELSLSSRARPERNGGGGCSGRRGLPRRDPSQRAPLPLYVLPRYPFLVALYSAVKSPPNGK
jgi:hypothetical protein